MAKSWLKTEMTITVITPNDGTRDQVVEKRVEELLQPIRGEVLESEVVEVLDDV